MPTIDSIDLHPKNHFPSSLKSHVYDVISLGSGWAGRVIAARAVAAGLTAVVVERELIGGDCPFWVCVPSKGLLRPDEALDGAKHVGGAKERLVLENIGVDVEAVFRRRDALTSGWDDTAHLIPIVEKSGTDIVRGVGKIIGEKKVAIEMEMKGSNWKLATLSLFALEVNRLFQMYLVSLRQNPGDRVRRPAPVSCQNISSSWVVALSAPRWRRRIRAMGLRSQLSISRQSFYLD
jgi:hypothetical protein